MELRTYIRNIKKYGNIGGYREDLLCNLIKNAGGVDAEAIPLETAKNWFKTDRQGPIKKCFPDGDMDDKKFILFLKPYLNSDWRKLQKSYEDLNDNSCFVDVKTDNEDQFYQSMAQQFRKCIGLPIPVDLSTQTKSQAKTVLPMCLIDKFDNGIKKYGITDIIEFIPKESIPAWHINNLLDFINHMKDALTHTALSIKDKKIYDDIDVFVEQLREYRDYLFKNFESSQFAKEPNFNKFILDPENNELFALSVEHFRGKPKRMYCGIEEKIKQIFEN